MTNTKRVDELEVGDIITLPYNKGVYTVLQIKGIRYQIISEGISEPRYHNHDEEVAYFGNINKKEDGEIMVETNINKIMEAKVDCSVLYPYLDALIKSESKYHVLDLPSYLKKELTNIYELFEGVLELSLEEVKTLYFERKLGKSSLDKEKDSEFTTKKKAKELCIGDKVVIFTNTYDSHVETITKLQEFSPTQIRIITEQGTEAIFQKDKVVSLLD